jgi:ribosome biogenesis GTPase / thiamine phosphate phosphatase
MLGARFGPHMENQTLTDPIDIGARMAEYRRRERLRRQVKKAPVEERVRRRQWDEDAEDGEVFAEERIMPRGEQERRRAVAANSGARSLAEGDTVTAELPIDAPPSVFTPAAGAAVGVVVEVTQGMARVRVGAEVWLARPTSAAARPAPGLANPLAAGDRVEVLPLAGGQGQITAVLPRTTLLTRPDVALPHRSLLVAANATQLLIVASWRAPAFWPELVDRYLIAATRHGLRSCLCINKIDLADGSAPALDDPLVLPYARLGVPLLFASGQTGFGVAELRAQLVGESTILAGLSGVGKSTLLAAVDSGLELRTGEVSARRHAGKHTTTAATFYPLSAGGSVIDTPGIQEFGLAGLGPHDIAGFYPELRALAPQCRYHDCMHLGEAGCAAPAALAEGRLSEVRYASYRKIVANP